MGVGVWVWVCVRGWVGGSVCRFRCQWVRMGVGVGYPKEISQMETVLGIQTGECLRPCDS